MDDQTVYFILAGLLLAAPICVIVWFLVVGHRDNWWRK